MHSPVYHALLSFEPGSHLQNILTVHYVGFLYLDQNIVFLLRELSVEIFPLLFQYHDNNKPVLPIRINHLSQYIPLFLMFLNASINHLYVVESFYLALPNTFLNSSFVSFISQNAFLYYRSKAANSHLLPQF